MLPGSWIAGRRVPMQASYLAGLREVPNGVRPADSAGAVPGEYHRNFEPDAAIDFLYAIRLCLQPGDALLLGTDLVKPVDLLRMAYDDPVGVTAAFNLNLLARINRELDADFELRQFEHLVRYNAEAQRIEMHLRSRCTRS